MTDIATTARENALPVEMRKIAYRQSAKDGLVITFAVHPDDMPADLAGAPIGSRYMVALVGLNDDETPKERDKERRQWHELTPASQSAIRCNEKAFQLFMKVGNAEDAAEAVRKACEVSSRSEISTSDRARDKWEHLDAAYQQWLRS